MNADDIRKLNEDCQKKAQAESKESAHDAAMVSLELSLLAELAAQVAETKECLVKIANPPTYIASADDIHFGEIPGSGKITVMPEVATLRDQFAMAAMTGLLSNTDTDLSKPLDRFAQVAFLAADAMLAVRKK